MITTRRGFVVASVSASLAGCASTNGDDQSTKSPDGTTGTSPPAPGEHPSPTRTKPPEGVFLGLTNDTDSERSVTVTIRRDGERVFDETVTLAAGERIGRRAVVTEPGEYRIIVAVGSEMTRTLTQRFPDENGLAVERYALEIEVRADDVTFLVLHGDPAPTPSETNGRI